MAEIIRTKCDLGHLVITEKAIRLESDKGNISLFRFALIGVHIKRRIFSLKKVDVEFHARKDILLAQLVQKDDVKKIVKLLKSNTVQVW